MKRLKQLFYQSLTYQLWQWIDRHIVQSRFVQFFIDPAPITHMFYQSALYQSVAPLLTNSLLKLPRTTLPKSNYYLSFVILFLLLFPHTGTTPMLIFGTVLFYGIRFLSEHSNKPTSVTALSIGILLLFAYGIFAFILSRATLLPLGYLFLGVWFFFLVSYDITSRVDLTLIFQAFYAALLVLLLPQNPVRSDLSLLLLFPFGFAAVHGFSSRPRRIFHLSVLLMLAFYAAAASRQPHILIGFILELLLLLLLVDLRYLPLLLLLSPALAGAALSHLVAMWSEGQSSVSERLVSAAYTFWGKGFGVGKAALPVFPVTDATQSTILFPELGVLGFAIFLWYLLRLARGTVTGVFTGGSEFRPYFAAGFAFLVGVSAATFLNGGGFSPQLLVGYWGLLGILRGIRRIRFGVINP